MSRRLTTTESFRAKVWRDLFAQERVRALPMGAYKLLVGIVSGVLNSHNNAAFTLGPKTLSWIGVNGHGGAEKAIHELVEAKLLV